MASPISGVTRTVPVNLLPSGSSRPASSSAATVPGSTWAGSGVVVVPDVSLWVIPDAFLDRSKVTVLDMQPGILGPYWVGEGDVNWLCGACGFVLAKDLIAGQITGNPVLICPSCRGANQSRI